MSCRAWHLGNKVPCLVLVSPLEALQPTDFVGHHSDVDQVCAVERSLLCDRALLACLGFWMRGLRRAYDPHLAVRHWRQLFSSRLVWVWGSPPPYRAGLSGELTSPSGSCFGCPMGTYPPFTGGAKSRVTRKSGFGWERLRVWIVRGGAVHIGGQGWFGEAPEHPVFFVVLLPALRAGGAHHRSKGRRQGGSFPTNLARIYP
jgi:hypothetical protein